MKAPYILTRLLSKGNYILKSKAMAIISNLSKNKTDTGEK